MRMAEMIAAAAVAAALSAAAAAGAESNGEREKKWAGTGKSEVTLTLNGSSVEDFLKVVQKYTNRIFLYPDRLKSVQVFARGTREIPVDALFPIFESVLAINGYSISPTPDGHGGEILKIIASREASWRPGETYSKEEYAKNPSIIPDSDRMVSLIYPLKYAQATVTMNSLRQLISPMGGYIQGIDNVEVLIISDFAPNVRRIAEIIELMDVPGPSLSMDVMQLKNAPAADIIKIVSRLTTAPGARGQAQQPQMQGRGQMAEAYFASDDRTNSIIVQAMPDQMEKVRKLINKLDVRMSGAAVGINIIRLKHTNAEDMEDQVNQILDARPTLLRSGASQTPVPADPSGMPMPRMPLPPGQGGDGKGQDESRMAAIADKVTNSLIVVAPEAEFEEIRKVIEQIDVRRPQVLVEVAIVEINAGSGLSMGVELTTMDGARDGRTRGFAATQWGFSNMVDNDGNPILPGSSGYPAGRFPTSTSGMLVGFHRGKEYRIPVLLNLLGNESEINVISMPHIVTIDNKKAEIRVLNMEPTSTSSSTAAVSNQIGFGGFEEAGVTLIITPHISSNDYLRLELSQKISQFTGNPTVLESGGQITGILPPGKSTNELKTVITIPNGRTVVIGGLTSTKKTRTISKVPLLGDLPLLGTLFRRESSDKKKMNLFVFITPHILKDDDFKDYGRISGGRLDEAAESEVETSLIDRHHRKSGAMEREMLERPRGSYLSPLDYRRAED